MRRLLLLALALCSAVALTVGVLEVAPTTATASTLLLSPTSHQPPPPSGGSTLTGIDFDGNPTNTRMVYWDQSTVGTDNLPDAYPMTVFAKVFLRTNTTITTRPDGSRYGTIFFYGNNGNGTWDCGGGSSGCNNTYWGIEPYPSPLAGFTPDEWKFELATWNRDFVDRMDGSNPYPTFNSWYSVALAAKSSGCDAPSPDASKTQHVVWVGLPNTSTANKIKPDACYRQSPANWGAEPPNRSLFFGQSPPFPGQPTKSWGGYDHWDECNCIIRGIQIYTAYLSESQVVALSACDTDACVLGALAGQGISGSTLWYLNMNPTPTDITDKSGNGHHGSWNHASYRPTLWTGSLLPANDDLFDLEVKRAA